MSSFSGWACVDLKDGQDSGGFLAALSENLEMGDRPLLTLVEGGRVYILADFTPHLSATISTLVPAWARRAITAADFDEYGVLHEVVGPDGESVHVASIDEQNEESTLPDHDTPEARRAAAELFGVDPAPLDKVSATWSLDGARPSTLGEPYLAWWDALGAPWPADFGERAMDVSKPA
ncbi:hypothetical protein [Actinomadura sp. HBU206391]|uniref:hypothetical protein n=1 Tax=Actinomadura sp. HBU206391 TaxID=2731692 RepID=UPI0016508D20|nr:hypothetical protein [Actinomadura sp. HBU206391]MBC6458890.1 hypothetical protein [Actinomadura sp. HBU206391]